MIDRYYTQCDDSQLNSSIALFDRIPEYQKILTDLSKGNLSGNFDLSNRKSKLNHSLEDILFGNKVDELSYLILFMESKGQSNYIKFLLDLNNFKQTLVNAQDENLHPNEQEKIAEDALAIYKTYISKDAKYSIDLPDQLIADSISQMCPEEGARITGECFDQAKSYIKNIIQHQFYEKYILSECHCKYLINILRSHEISISDILYDNSAIVYLLEYLEHQNVSDILKFWIQAENFSRNLLNFERKIKSKVQKLESLDLEIFYKQWQTDAMVIYDNFISLQAKSSLGFDDLVRRQVELNICQTPIDEDSSIKLAPVNENIEQICHAINSYSNCFYLPMIIVFSLLDKVYFKRFIKSNMYVKYIGEVLNRTLTTMSTGSSHSSDESSSLSSSNSSLNKRPTAIVTKQHANSNKGQLSKQPPIIESVPNQLWSRPNDKMQIGSIDSTGRFVPYLKHEPVDDNEVSNDVSVEDMNDVWSLKNDEPNFDINNIVHVSSKSKLRKKFNRFLDMLPMNRRGGRQRSRSRSTETGGYFRVPDQEEDDEEKIAERIAAMIVSDVMKSNNQILQ